VPDWIYSRIPYIWLSIGLLFLLIGLAAGPEFRLFYAYILFSLVCLFRALYVYQARRRFHRRNRVAFLHETQVIDHTKK
jgi:hypothetical protein